MIDKIVTASLVSVIVPVYNAEKYLARAIDSVLAQTHKNLELILIDDGSMDGSGAICDDYATQDPRVKVIHKANGGVSAARNDGIEAAEGEFIAFCDNDDFMAPGMLARLLEICADTDADIAHCRRERALIDTLPTPPPQKVKVMTGREALENFYAECTPYVWDKLCRRRVWRDVRFPVGSYAGEDVTVVHHLLWAARKIAVTREKLYCHYLNPGSVMLRGFDVRWATGALNDRLELARREGLTKLYADTMVRRLYEEEYLLVMNRKYNRDADSRRAFAREHRALRRRYYREAMAATKNGVAGIDCKTRLFMGLCRYAPGLYNLYNWLKWRVVRGEGSVKFGEVK
ncbi:MAG: glycosyltransferase [Alistipes sp.]|jgi:glycosyltransferase involved in cell wall biosynthesis|nr:glycosyltransferase [Alistipes sp.]